jgi:N-acetylneuraminic acid mutarotase
MRNRLTFGVVFCVLFITTTTYAQMQGAWAAYTGNNPPPALEYNVQVLLNNGYVLIAGGWDGTNYYTEAQLYNPSKGTWTATGKMATARAQFAAVVLPSGKVLVEGGETGSGSAVFASAELYDPKSGTWSPAASMLTARYGHTATLLQDGKVMVTGGCVKSGCSLVTGDTEIYDPNNGAEGTWTQTKQSLNTPRAFHTATLFAGNTKVLVVGGCTSTCGSSGITASSEIFTPNYTNLTSSTWTKGPNSSVARYQHTATLLSNGKVLVAGGGYAQYIAYNYADLYDPTAGSFSATVPMKQSRFAHTATALPNNTVLIAGGETIKSCGFRGQGRCSVALGTAEIYDYNVFPTSPTFSCTPPNCPGSLNTARGNQTATLLPSGDVLVAGGCTGYDCYTVTPLASEIYTPLTLYISPYSLNFGLEEKGVTSPGQPIKVTNVSHAPVTFKSIATSGNFSQTKTCPTTPQNLAAGANCTINVTFNPTTTGTRTGAVTLIDNSVGSPSQTIVLTGTGEPYAISFTPSSLTLPSVLPSGTTYKTVTVTNDGSAPVTISNIAIAPANGTPVGTFTVYSTNCPVKPSQLGGNLPCTIQVAFTPPDSITFNATLQVVDNAPGSPHLLPLTGMGID